MVLVIWRELWHSNRLLKHVVTSSFYGLLGGDYLGAEGFYGKV